MRGLTLSSWSNPQQHAGSTYQHHWVKVGTRDWRRRVCTSRQCSNGGASGTNRVFDREDAVPGQLAELPDNCKIPRTIGPHIRSIAGLTGHELAGDKRHSTGKNPRTFKPCLFLLRQLQVRRKLFDDFIPCRLPHRFFDHVAGAVTAQTVAPERVAAVFLATEMRLMEKDDGKNPA